MAEGWEGKMTYNPRDHMIKLPGRKGGSPIDYLPVKERVHWLREEHPDADISTQVIELTETRCVMLARVSIPSGGSATAIGSEMKVAFADYIEKSDTVALGRALAILGYGIDFSDEFTESKALDVADERDYEVNKANTVAQTTASKRYHTRSEGEPPVARGLSDEMPENASPTEIAEWFQRRMKTIKALKWAGDVKAANAQSLAVTLNKAGMKDADRLDAYEYLTGERSGKTMSCEQLYLLQLNSGRVADLLRCALAFREERRGSIPD